MSTRDRLFRFTPPLSEIRIPSAHLMIEDKHLFGLEALLQPYLHVPYIGPGDDGGVFEFIIGIWELLVYNFKSMSVQTKLRLCAANVGNRYVFHIFIFHIGLFSTRDMLDGDIDRERFLSWLAFVKIESPQIADSTADCHDGNTSHKNLTAVERVRGWKSAAGT